MPALMCRCCIALRLHLLIYCILAVEYNRRKIAAGAGSLIILRARHGHIPSWRRHCAKLHKQFVLFWHDRIRANTYVVPARLCQRDSKSLHIFVQNTTYCRWRFLDIGKSQWVARADGGIVDWWVGICFETCQLFRCRKQVHEKVNVYFQDKWDSRA